MSNSSITDSHLGAARGGGWIVRQARVTKITTRLVEIANGSNHAKLAPTLAACSLATLLFASQLDSQAFAKGSVCT